MGESPAGILSRLSISISGMSNAFMPSVSDLHLTKTIGEPGIHEMECRDSCLSVYP